MHPILSSLQSHKPYLNLPLIQIIPNLYLSFFFHNNLKKYAPIPNAKKNLQPAATPTPTPTPTQPKPKPFAKLHRPVHHLSKANSIKHSSKPLLPQAQAQTQINFLLIITSNPNPNPIMQIIQSNQ